MRFPRRQLQRTSRGVYGQDDIPRDTHGQVVPDSKDMMLVPKGTIPIKLQVLKMVYEIQHNNKCV